MIGYVAINHETLFSGFSTSLFALLAIWLFALLVGWLTVSS